MDDDTRLTRSAAVSLVVMLSGQPARSGSGANNCPPLSLLSLPRLPPPSPTPLLLVLRPPSWPCRLPNSRVSARLRSIDFFLLPPLPPIPSPPPPNTTKRSRATIDVDEEDVECVWGGGGEGELGGGCLEGEAKRLSETRGYDWVSPGKVGRPVGMATLCAHAWMVEAT